MFNDRIWRGVTSLLDGYAQIRPLDVAVVLYTSDCYEPAAWISAGLKVRDVETRRLCMSPLVDPDLGDRLTSVLQSSPIPSRLVLFTLERDTFSHTNVIHNALAEFAPAWRTVLRMISATAEVFEDTLTATPAQLSAINSGLLEALMPGRTLRIKTEGGTDMTFKLDPSLRWISNRGRARAGGMIVLPAGEVATCPAEAEGIFVADFAFNVNTEVNLDVRLDHTPVTVRLKDGHADSVSCENAELQKFLDDCFSMEYATQIGELGFGTNPGVVSPIAHNSHRNERRRGIHLGFGQHNQDKERMGYQADIHLDLIAKGGKVWVDGAKDFIDLEKVRPSSQPHTLHARDEDVFSPDAVEPSTEPYLEEQDCCGLIKRGR